MTVIQKNKFYNLVKFTELSIMPFCIGQCK